MDDTEYSKRELDMKFLALTEKVDENHKETLEEIGLLSRRNDDKHLQTSDRLIKIEEKVTFTNGKVRKLEKWQAGLIMAGTTALILGGTIVGLVVYIYQYQLNIQTTRITNLKSTITSLQTSQI